MRESLSPETLDAVALEAWLRAEGGLHDARVRALRAERIGVGFGLDGHTARVRLDGDGVPPTLVLKWARTEKALPEAAALGAVAPHLGASVPRLLGSVADVGDGRGLLVLEDVAPARQGDCVAGIDARDAAAVLAVAGKLHATFADGVGAPRVRSWGGDLADEADRTADALPTFRARHDDALAAPMLALAERLPALLPRARAALAAAPRTLIHGDLHADNVLFRSDGSPVVLDWPDAAVGPAAADFAHLLVDGVLAPTRRASEDALVEGYLDALAAHGAPRRDAAAFRREVAHALVVAYGGVVRWTARIDGLAADVPRARALRATILANLAAAFEDGWATVA